MKEPQRKKSPSLKTITKNEDRIIDQTNGLEAKISREGTRTTIMMGLEIPPIITRTSLQDRNLHTGIIAQIMGDHLINAQISHSIETMEIDLGMVLSTTRMGTGETMEIFLFLHRPKEENIRRIVHTANQELISRAILRSADLTIDLQLVLRPMNKNFRGTIIKQHLM